MKKKVEIGKHGKVLIKWNVMPIDYSHDKENEIISKFAKKYGIPKENVSVEPVLIQKGVNGNNETLADGIIDDVQDPKFQQTLFKTYLELNEVKDYDFDKILEIDETINNRIDYEAYDKHKKYEIKWIKWSNFMSYGKDNYFDFTKVKGLALLKSEPANQGGKSTFCLDLIRFLLFGKVTSRENDWTLASVFNRYCPKETECSVEGCVCIDGTDYIIKRVITRPKYEKRTDKSKVTQKISYYKLINDEYISLDDEENLNESNGRDTNKVIKDAIGNEKDFDLMICVDRRNLEGLISLKDTDRGRLISRWIGLLPLEEKDKLAREAYNQEVAPSLLSNKYNKDDLETKIKELKTENSEHEKEKKKLSKNEEESNKRITDYKTERDKLLQSKLQIDPTLLNVDVATVNARISDIKENGVKKRAEKAENEKQLAELGTITFNENDYRELEEKCTAFNVEIATMRERLKTLKASIETLKKGEFCPTCGAKLKNVDNSKAISEKEEEIKKLIEDGKKKNELLKSATELKEKLSKERDRYNNKIRLELIIQKNGVDIENLLAQYREQARLLKDIEANKSAIEQNNKIQTSLNVIESSIKEEESVLKLIQGKINEENACITYNNKVIKESEEILKILEKETVTIRSWKIYLEMVGKHGISKLVLRKALPIINAELRRMLEGVCDFDVEISIDDRNDVEFYYIHDGVKAKLGGSSGFEETVASLALRSVLSKISTFSKPSFVVFDEILGGVADENYENVKKLYDKIVKDYSLILQISHLKSIYDWHDTVITVTKENNISRIKVS